MEIVVVHDTAPYVPAAHTQAATDELPLGEVVPVGQLVHAAKELAPVTPEYVPAGHETHALAPASVYVPAGQFTHTVDEVAPLTPEYFPAGQLVHTAAPTVLLKLPAAHDAHAPPSGPVEPALHVQKPSPALTVLYNAVISAGVSTRLYT